MLPPAAPPVAALSPPLVPSTPHSRDGSSSGSASPDPERTEVGVDESGKSISKSGASFWGGASAGGGGSFAARYAHPTNCRLYDRLFFTKI